MVLRQFLVVVPDAADQRLDELFSRCDDVTVTGTPTSAGLRIEVAFDREAPTLVDALVSAIRDLDAVGLVAESVHDDDDLVSVTTIAERTGRPAEAVHRWVAGEVGPGAFPAAVDWAADLPLHRWGEVVGWLARNLGHVEPDPSGALAALNYALRLRALAPTVERIAAVRSLLPGGR